ncbi:MAG: class I SAM-dependent methyltransferase [Phycisphaerales bacterium]|nr:class I SAM-dependent methyltransferase [Phycisphaerales bacterium]
MSLRTIQVTDEIYDYLLRVSLRESPVLRRLRARTARLKNANMQISPEQGQFMALLVELIGARRALEVGTFTGYSALWVAAALPADGTLLCCDVSREWTDIARGFWREAGVEGKIELRLAPAQKTLAEVLAGGGAGTFDFAFIDADKEGYDAYYEATLQLLRRGGLVAFDNALGDGELIDPRPDDTHAQALDALNRKVLADERVTSSLVPIGDGLLLARKR